ncbi:MAG TPA: hypothetical protein VGM62_19010 [Chthoniobacterales bacterium]
MDPIEAALYEIEHGPLADFPLFHQIAALTPGVLESCPLSESELATRERELGDALVQMVKQADSPSLERVVRVVRHFTDKPDYPNAELKNPEALHEDKAMLLFFREHAGEDHWTLREIQEHLSDEDGVTVNLKTLQRRCEDFNFPFKAGQAGRPTKS